MVVMAMTAIMLAITLMSLNGARDQKFVESEARKMAAEIREIQNYTLTGKKFNATQPTCYIGIDAVISPATAFDTNYYSRKLGSCPSGTSTEPINGVYLTSSPIQTYSLSNGVSFSVDTAFIVFRVPRGSVYYVNEADNTLVAPSTPIQYILQKNGAHFYSVCIYSSGMVKDVVGATCP